MRTAKMKIEDVIALRDAAMKEKEQQQKELSELVKQQGILQKRCIAAKHNGNFEAYREASDEYDNIRLQISAIRNRMAKPSYNVPEIVSAWNGYVERHNAELEKKLKSFKQKVSDLGQDYREIIALQNEALLKEDACLSFMPVPGMGHKDMKAVVKLPSGAVAESSNYPDTCFFRAYGVFTKNEAWNAQTVINGLCVHSLDDDTSAR